ncbi:MULTISPECIES: TetR/AcrR family transcriptional regulator [unclassified Agrococcus]|uniref:TetR/AcrR family transcriptional regulator n=1 Tax=unclassified Agrococcus TaxID=2615065 RepID=UPI00361A4FE4
MSPDRSPLRKAPVQRRAADRVDELLDAAAAVVDEVGTELLTTTLVAERAGAGVGTVYRYFPDRLAILQGIAERNRHLLVARLERTIATPRDDVEDELEALFDAYVDVYRTVPAYRGVRTGELLPTPQQAHGVVVDALVDAALAVLGPRHGISTGGATREAFVDSFHVVDALVAAAFLDEADGDPRALRLAYDVGRATVHRLVRRETAQLA